MKKDKTSSSYFEKLKHPLWQKKRLEVFEAANWTCEDCYAKDKTLTVHHTYYEFRKEPWEYGLDTLMCLCEDCHESRQSLERDAKLVFGRLLRSHRNNRCEVETTDLMRIVESMVNFHSEDIDEMGMVVVGSFRNTCHERFVKAFCAWANVSDSQIYSGLVLDPSDIERLLEKK